MSVLCRLGLHRWTPWEQVWRRRALTMPTLILIRDCRRCGCFERRETP